jgi:hypothetical protein
VAFGAFTGLSVPYALAQWWGRSAPAFGVAVASAGLVGVACSVLVYAATRRASWRASRVTSLFAMTSAVGGIATVLWASSVAGTPLPHHPGLLLALAGLVAIESAVARHGRPGLVPIGLAMILAFGDVSGIALTFGLTLLLLAVLRHEFKLREAFFTDAGPPR